MLGCIDNIVIRDQIITTQERIYIIDTMYSQTCIKRSPFGQSKSGLIRQVTYLILFRNYTLVKTNVSTDFFLKVICYFILCIKIKTIFLCTV
jgi:hypothetical protein